MTHPIRYSRGRDTYDNKPAQREAANFDDFAAAVLSDRSKKKGQAYICAPFQDGHHSNTEKYPDIGPWRSSDLVQPRAFLPFDCDGFDSPETYAEMLQALNRYKGFAYTTASHTAEKPRCRVVLALSRETSREEGILLGGLIAEGLQSELITGGIQLDASVYRGEQPLYTPLENAEAFHFSGGAIDVDDVLASADLSLMPTPRKSVAERAQAIATNDPVLQRLAERGMIKATMDNGRFAVHCPCADAHTSESNQTSTIYALPNFNGFAEGRFICQHDHCKPRPQGEFLLALGLEPEKVEDDAQINELARLSPIEYDRKRKEAAERLGVRASILDKLVQSARAENDAETEGGASGGAVLFDEVDPWPTPVDGAALLEETYLLLARYVIADRETLRAATLWAALTWFSAYASVLPLAVITAPEKGCGKSTLLTALSRLACRPLYTSNITASALFRAVDKWQPTLLIDEADTFAKDNEELRGIINAGHTRETAYIIRSVEVGGEHEPRRFSVWGAKALAGIGRLPGTIMSRAVVLTMRRKLPNETAENLRHCDRALFEGIKRKLARWVTDVGHTFADTRPTVDGLHNREADNWEPLLALADIAGGHWPQLARQAAVRLTGGEEEAPSINEELLADIKAVFERLDTPRIPSVELLVELCQDEESAWATYNRGKPVTARQLSKRLGEFGIKPKPFRGGAGVVKGYTLDQFTDVFARYLP